MGNSTLVGFADADAFYASAEVVRRPWLAGLPLGVLGNQGACVIARNYPMKKCGVTVGEPIWEAKKKCPHGLYVKRNFRWYETLSRRMLGELGQFSPTVEYYSIDEFFWTAEPIFGSDWARSAVHVRDHIRSHLGLPMTVAFARTRVLAKLFADTAKPFGAVAVLDRHHERELLARLPVTEIAGIARRMAARLEPYRIKTCLDLADANGGTVKRLLTVVGFDLWRELNGERVHTIRPERTAHKMLSRGGSLAGRVTDPYTLYGWLVRNVERLIEELQYHTVRPRTLTVHLSYFEEPSASASRHFPVPTDSFLELLDGAKAGLRRCWRSGSAATHLHLIASELVRPAGWQRTLFDPPNETEVAVAKLKHEVNATFGRFTLRSGSTLYANHLYQDPANDYDVCDIRGKFCF